MGSESGSLGDSSFSCRFLSQTCGSWARSSQSSPCRLPCPERSVPPAALCFTSALDNKHLTSSLQGEPGPRGLVGPPGSRGNPVSDSVLMFFFFFLRMGLSRKTAHHFVLMFM